MHAWNRRDIKGKGVKEKRGGEGIMSDDGEPRLEDARELHRAIYSDQS